MCQKLKKSKDKVILIKMLIVYSYKNHLFCHFHVRKIFLFKFTRSLKGLPGSGGPGREVGLGRGRVTSVGDSEASTPGLWR